MVRSRVLVVSQDPVGERMAGPAIRAFELSRVLSHEHDVVLATRERPGREGDGFETRSYGGELETLCRRSDVVVAFGRLLADEPSVARSDAAIVADLYDPAPFEALLRHDHDDTRTRWLAARDARRVLEAQLAHGDFFLCASQRQRDLVTGMLTVAGRVNPATFDADPTLESLVAIVPFGVPNDPPVGSGNHPLRADGPFADDDLVALWGGGLWDWLDPVTFVEAVAHTDERVKAYFMGGTHPSPAVGRMRAHDEAVDRARDLGLLDTRIVFSDDWIPYEQRVDVLLDADVGVSLHRRHLETRYAFRTRVLDYLWAGLPVIGTEGDVVADLVERSGCGAVVPAGDAEALAEALTSMLDPQRRRQAGAQAAIEARHLRWDSVAEPLKAFVASPRRAADRDSDTSATRRRLETRAGISERVEALRRRFRRPR